MADRVFLLILSSVQIGSEEKTVPIKYSVCHRYPIHSCTNQSKRRFKQISRPVFAVMEKGPLSELCSYISYDSAYDLG
jgi:hypothetical protein